MEKNPEIKFSYIGFKGYLEEKLASENNIKFIGLEKKNNRFLFYLDNNIMISISKLINNVDAVISSGGGHSFHILKYAKRKKIPFYLIEENIKMGWVNCLFFHKAKKLYSPFRFKGKNYLQALHPSCLIKAKADSIQYDFLFLGGSLGSDIIARLAIKMRHMPYKSLLICGRKKEKYLKYQNKNLEIKGFENLENYYNKADIIITRAGSSTLFELLKLNKKMIIIPSKKTRGNHQVINAEFFSNNNLAIYLDEKSANINNLLEIAKYNFENIIKAQNKYLNSLSLIPYEQIITNS